MYQHGGDIYHYPDFTDFSANINLLGPPSSVLQTVRKSAEEICHYPQPGCGNLCQAIADLEQLPVEKVICGNGAAEVIFSLVLAEKPKKALLFAPAFQEYERALRSVDCEIVYKYLEQKDGFRFLENPAELDDTIDMVFFCNPNNPTGVLTEGIRMESLLRKCEETDTLLVVDECFMDFVDWEEQQNVSMKGFLRDSHHLFLIKAFTKSFGMPGLRLGYGLCGNARVLEGMQAVVQPWSVSVLAQEAGIAATLEKNFLEKTREAVDREKQFLLQELAVFAVKKEKGFFVKVYGCAANYIFFKSIPGLSTELKKYKILIRDCSNFPGLCQGWYRAAVRKREENQRLIDALKQIGFGIKRGGT